LRGIPRVFHATLNPVPTTHKHLVFVHRVEGDLGKLGISSAVGLDVAHSQFHALQQSGFRCIAWLKHKVGLLPPQGLLQVARHCQFESSDRNSVTGVAARKQLSGDNVTTSYFPATNQGSRLLTLALGTKVTRSVFH